MAFTVFYSWQSNLPDETNKELIQGALSEAANDLNNDDSITIDTIIERDTKGVSGSPHIVKAILDKIDRCDLFVADVSIINSHDKIGRKTPNPNVLIELGYALHRLGFEGVVLVMNKYYGEPIELPFDLPKHKVTLYTLSIENIDNTACKKYLKEEFIEAFKLGIDEHKKDIHAHQNPKWEETYHAVVDKKINAPILIDEYIKQLISDINDINPKYSDQASDLECIPFLTSAIESAINLVSNFCEVCEIIALANNMSYCLRLLHALSKILEFYNLRQQLSTRAIQFDLFKVIGHQLFVIFYSYLMQERQFALIASLLLEKYDISNATNYRFTQVDYRYYSMRTSILFHSESNDLYHHAPRHSNILYNLFRPDTIISSKMSFSKFADMDALLFLRSELLPKTKQFEYEWTPWGAWGRYEIEGKTPISFSNLSSNKFVMNVLGILGVNSIDDLKKILIKKKESSRYGLMGLMSNINIEDMGTMP